MSTAVLAAPIRRVVSVQRTKAARSETYHGVKVAFTFQLSDGTEFKNNVSCSIEKHLACTYPDHGDYDPTGTNGPNTISSHTVVEFVSAFDEFAAALLEYIARQPDFDKTNPSSAGVIATSFKINFRTDTDWAITKKYLHSFPADGNNQTVFDLQPAEFKAFHQLQKFFTTKCYSDEPALIRKQKMIEANGYLLAHGHKLWFSSLLPLTPTEIERYIESLTPVVENQHQEELKDKEAKLKLIRAETERKMKEASQRQATEAQGIEEDLDLGFFN
jgi:hypothetical protein